MLQHSLTSNVRPVSYTPYCDLVPLVWQVVGEEGWMAGWQLAIDTTLTPMQ